MENTFERRANKYIYAAVVVLGALIVASAIYMRADAQTSGDVDVDIDITATTTDDCPQLQPGDRFKVPTHSAVYLLNADKRRMYFPHETVYFTWYDSFEGIKVIPNKCIDNYPSPNETPLGINYRFGSQLIKTVLSPSVYVIEPGSQIRKLNNESIARALYGTNWNTKVKDLPDVFWANYDQQMVPVATSTPHSGMLIRQSGSSTTYFVINSFRYRVTGSIPSTMQASIQTVDEAVFNKVKNATSTTVTAEEVRMHPSTNMHGGIQ